MKRTDAEPPELDRDSRRAAPEYADTARALALGLALTLSAARKPTTPPSLPHQRTHP
ncbi:hypothetical protein AB0C59_11855 [Streptomyces sp. NPDC048664]|uniref:hypothetical protein n=1 Tax=Streptomyces sp. NPDC048664 TaxID=3154505 RepID=UPI0034445510